MVAQLRIGFSTGFAALGNYWGNWPFGPGMMGGSERIVTEVARALGREHEVVVRLPYLFPPENDHPRRQWGVTWLDADAPAPPGLDILFAVDDYEPRDHARVSALVACRSDPPPHSRYDQLIFLSAHHAALMGHAGRPFVGGGVHLDDYAAPRKRVRGRVICTSSPDRCPQASAIGSGFDFVHTYRPVMGVGREMDRATLIETQQTAMAHIYPLDPRRPSDFFSMSVLESMAAGTPVVVSDADAMPELWGESALVLPRPIRLAEWVDAVEEVMGNKRLWCSLHERGLTRAAELTWEKQAQRYLDIAVRS